MKLEFIKKTKHPINDKYFQVGQVAIVPDEFGEKCLEKGSAKLPSKADPIEIKKQEFEQLIKTKKDANRRKIK